MDKDGAATAYPSWCNAEKERNRRIEELSVGLVQELTNLGPTGVMRQVTQAIAEQRGWVEDALCKAFNDERAALHGAIRILNYASTGSANAYSVGTCRHCSGDILKVLQSSNKHGLHISLFCGCRDLLISEPTRRAEFYETRSELNKLIARRIAGWVEQEATQ